MALNEWDEALEQLAPTPAPRNPYDDLVARRVGEQQQRTSIALSQATETSPDRAADVQRLAREMRVPAAVVERNYDQIKKRASVVDVANLQRRAPTLSDWIAEPENAQVAQDDLPQLEKIEKSLTFLESIKRGVDVAQGMFYGTVEATGELMTHTAEGLGGKALINGIGRSLINYGRPGRIGEEAELKAGGRRREFAKIEGIWDLAQWAKETIGEQIPIMAPIVAGGLAGGAAGSTLGPAGTTIGAAIGAFFPGLILGVGEVQGNIKEIDPNAEVPLAAFVGGSGVAALDSVLPGRIGGRLVTTFGRETAEAIAKRALMAPVKPKYLRQVSGGMATEGLTEAIQEAIGAVAAAGGTGTDVNFEQLWSQMVEAGAAGALLGFSTTAVETSAERRMFDVRASAAEQNQQVFEHIAEGVKDSRLYQRMPEKAQEFIARATKDGPLETVHLPIETWRTYWQEKGVDPALAAQEMTGSATAYEQAVQEGTDLAVPTAVYAIKIAPTEHHAFFVSELRLDPSEMNAREAKAWREEQARATSPTGADPLDPESPEGKIAANLTAQLEAAGHSPETAGKLATLLSQGFAKGLGRSGFDPMAIFEASGLKVQRPDISVSLTRDDGTRAETEVGAGRADSGAQLDPSGTERVSTEGSSRASLEPRQPDDIPQAFRGHFDALLADARERGVDVDDNALAARYLQRLEKAEELVADRREAMGDAQTPKKLLDAIAAGGGINALLETGYMGEIDALQENLGAIFYRTNPRTKEKGPRQYQLEAKLPGIAGPIITRRPPISAAQQAFARGKKIKGRKIKVPKSGMSLDTLREHLIEQGFEFDNLADMVEAIFDAVHAYQQGDQQASAETDIANAMFNIMGMQPGQDWFDDTVFDQSLFDAEPEIVQSAEWLARFPPPAEPGLYLQESIYGDEQRRAYFDGDTQIASSREVPQSAPIPPVGTWMIDDRRAALDGHEIQQLVEFPVGLLEISEDTGPGKFADVERYARWILDGLEPPPIRVIQTDKGTIKTLDHRRLLAAKAAGRDTVKAWVSWSVPSDRPGNPINGLTFELAQKQIAPLPIVPAVEGATIFGDDAKRLNALTALLREQQPRLPGAENVRDQEIATPEFEVPFALTSETAVRKGKQTTLFQAAVKQTETEAFQRWFGASKVVDAVGQPLIVHHGTARGDRVGNVFRKGRATSGPMAFFTDDHAIAESYSNSKQDTSLETPEDYREWFKFRPKGSRSSVNLRSAWYHLTAEQRATVLERLPTVGYQNPDESSGPIVAGSDSIASADHIAYLLRDARGNGLEAAKELWLSSGTLFDSEEQFLEVLNGLGLAGMFTMDSPWMTVPKVYDVYLSIQQPLVTSEMPQAVIDALDKRARRQRAKPESGGADLWDKRTRDPREWVRQLKADLAEGNNSMVWTSIPDWVTDTLKSFGYDGIHDTGGKHGGESHSVWIPFEPSQVKSATENRGTFDRTKASILYQPAWHGSPHLFEEFSLHKIGTGEGAQAYGWGLYFAGSRDIAQYYRDALTKHEALTVRDRAGKILAQGDGLTNVQAEAIKWLEIGASRAGEFKHNRLYYAKKAVEGSWGTFTPKSEQLKAEVLAQMEAWADASFGYERPRGRLFKVDIPDDGDYLLWDRPASEQSPKVQAALRKLGVAWTPFKPKTIKQFLRWFETKAADRLWNEDIGIRESLHEGFKLAEAGQEEAFARWFEQNHGLVNNGNTDPSGRSIYETLSRDKRNSFKGTANATGLWGIPTMKDGAKAASEALAAEGIAGIKYLDGGSRAKGEGSFNFVIFDDKLIKVIEYYQKQGDGKRGALRISPDRQFTIELFEQADLSTVLHESGHLFLELMGDLVDQMGDVAQAAPEQQKFAADYQALLNWFGVTSRDQITVEHHEQFARSFEAYLMDGKAPSLELRSLFASFRAWLLGIYRSVTALKVDVTPEVRGVFDRLLASDAAIAEAEQAANVQPMFTTQADAKMSDQQWAEYQALMADASTSTRERLDRELMAEVQREQTALWRRQFADTQAEVEREVFDLPVYKAIAAMRSGEHPDGTPLVEGLETAPLKLSKQILVERYGLDRLKALPRPYVYSVEGGLDPDVVAEMFGFTSGDEMLEAVRTATPLKDLVQAETKRRMLEQYGSMLLDGTIFDKAQAATANDVREQVIRAELRALFRGATPSAALLNETAATRIGAMKIRDIRPVTYWTAGNRAAAEAIALAAEGNIGGAVAAKQQQLLNLALYREATRVVEDVEARVRRARELAKGPARARIGLAGASYLDQVDGLLDRFEFARVSNKVLDRRASLASWVAGLEAEGLPVDLPEEVLNEARRRNYRELTVEEFVGVTDGLQHIAHLARFKNRLLKAQKQREFQEVVDEIEESIRENARKPRGTPERDRRLSEERRRLREAWVASHRKIASIARELDGFEDGGAVWEYIVRPLNAAGDAEATMNAEATQKFHTIIEAAYPGRDKSRLYEKQIVKAVNGSLSKMQVIMLAFNWGNTEGRQRVLSYQKWTESQVEAVLETLDAKDWQFISQTWEFLDSYWPAIEAKQRRVTGLAPAKVEAIPIRTKFGEMRGGYFPLKYDDRLSSSAASKLDLEAAHLAKQAAYVGATTKRGHTIERKAKVVQPIRQDFGVIFEHVGQVIHDLTHHEALIDIGRLLADKKVAAAIYETQGDIVYKAMKDAVRDVAFGDLPARNGVERGLNHLRMGMTVARLGWSISTAMLQPLGLTQSMVRIGPKWVAKGLLHWLGDAVRMERTITRIHEQSEFMRNRGRTQAREINEIRNQLGVDTGQFTGWVDDALKGVSAGVVHKRAIADSFFYLIATMQKVADVPTWLGAYEKAMAADPDEARAVALADQAVLDAQGGGQIKDMSSVQRGGPMMKIWTNFYSFFNTTVNLTIESTRRTKFTKPGQVGRLAVDYLLLYTIPATLGWMVRETFKDDGDDEESWPVALMRENLAYLAGTMVGLRELSGTISGYYGYQGPAGAGAFASAGKLLRQGEQILTGDDPLEEVDEAFWKSLNDTAGILLHYPAGQVGRTLDGIAALIDGTTSNPGALVAGGPKER